MSHLLLTAQRHTSVSSESQDFLLTLRSLTSTRRSSTSFLDILQRRPHWHIHSKPLSHPVCSCPQPEHSHTAPVKESLSICAFHKSPSHNNTMTFGNVSSTEAEMFPHGCNPQTDSVNTKPQIQANNSTQRHSLAPCCCPRYCQACRAMLLTAGGTRGSHELCPTSCHSSEHLNQVLSSGLPPLCLVHSMQPTTTTPIHQTTGSPSYMTASSDNISLPSQKPVTSVSSIHQTAQSTVHISPPSPLQTNHSCSGHVPVKSDLSMDILSPLLSPMSLASTQNMSSLSSTDLRSPLSPSSLGLPLFHMPAQLCDSRDRELSHLNHCLHRIISRRTSSPILMDRTARQPGSSHGHATIMYNLPVNNNQSLGSLPTTQHKGPDAPLTVLGSKVGQDFMVRQKMEKLHLIPEDMYPVQA